MISRQEMLEIQELVDNGSPEDRARMRANAETVLSEVNMLMGQRLLSAGENKSGNVAIEVLVRLEATERGKGWWFRMKRRPQLTKMYLGSIPMFSGLIKGDVNDDAVRLKTLTDQAISKYLPLSRDELEAALKRDFLRELSFVDDFSANFTFENAPEFTFMIMLTISRSDVFVSSLTVQGFGKYAGFSLSANASSTDHWFCSVLEGVSRRPPTGGAKKLVKVMGAKFDVPDLKDLMGLR